MSDDLTPQQAEQPPEGFTVQPWRRGFGRMIGPLYTKRVPGRTTVMGFRVEEHHANGLNACHGGMLVSFADMAWGRVVSKTAGTSTWVTVRLVTDFLSSAQLGEWVEGDSEILSRQGDLYTVRGRVWTGERTILTGTAVFKVLESRVEPKN